MYAMSRQWPHTDTEASGESESASLVTLNISAIGPFLFAAIWWWVLRQSEALVSCLGRDIFSSLCPISYYAIRRTAVLQWNRVVILCPTSQQLNNGRSHIILHRYVFQTQIFEILLFYVHNLFRNCQRYISSVIIPDIPRIAVYEVFICRRCSNCLCWCGSRSKTQTSHLASLRK